MFVEEHLSLRTPWVSPAVYAEVALEVAGTDGDECISARMGADFRAYPVAYTYTF